MLSHHLIIALRTLWRNRFHSFINVVGLAIGISACLVIYLVVSHELSFNKGMADYDRIYRLHSKFTGPFTGINRGAPSPAAGYVHDHFKGIERVSLFFSFSSDVAIAQGPELKKQGWQAAVVLAGPDYFALFNSYEWLAGSADVLREPGRVVLTESQAEKYFGIDNAVAAIGKDVVYRDSLGAQVAGIVRDLPFHTDFVFTDFISLPTLRQEWLTENVGFGDWSSTHSATQVFVKTLPGTTHNDLTAQLPELEKKYDEHSDWEVTNVFSAQPLSDLHYNGSTGVFDSLNHIAHLPTLYTLSGVAVLLLVIASINFINLATAQAANRAKETGVRKVLGSTRARLMIQYVCEGMLLTLIALAIALPVAELSLSGFREFVPEGVSLNLPDFLPFLVFVVTVVGLLASIYPAFVLSSFRPALALKNQTRAGSGRSRAAFLRKTLIVFQFTAAQVLILATIIIGWQIRYMLNKDLGFEKDAVVYFHTPWQEKHAKTILLKSELESIPEISKISLSQDPPSSTTWRSSIVAYRSGNEDLKIDVNHKFSDDRYLDLYEIPLLAGRKPHESDTAREFLINETMLKKLGFTSPQEAVGQYLVYNNDREIPVVGVVKDFHIGSLHTELRPVIMANALNDLSCINIRFDAAHRNGDALKESLDKLEAAWKKIYPDAPFEYHFLDDTIENFYRTEQRMAKLSATAMALAIVISCLGLFGLASFTTVQRTREIGIRKVLGATARQIVVLLSRDFLMLTVAAFVLAVPIAWISGDQWLQMFPYRTTPGVWMYAVTAVAAMTVAFTTVSFQTVKAANRNPTDSLRSE